MPYREPSDVVEPDDPEAAAVAVLRRRAERLRASIHVPLILCGVLGGVMLYAVLGEWELGSDDAEVRLSFWLTAALSFTPTIGSSLWLGPRLANFAVGRALPRWRKSLAAQHGLDEAELVEMTRLLE